MRERSEAVRPWGATKKRRAALRVQQTSHTAAETERKTPSGDKAALSSPASFPGVLYSHAERAPLFPLFALKCPHSFKTPWRHLHGNRFAPAAPSRCRLWLGAGDGAGFVPHAGTAQKRPSFPLQVAHAGHILIFWGFSLQGRQPTWSVM